MLNALFIYRSSKPVCIVCRMAAMNKRRANSLFFSLALVNFLHLHSDRSDIQVSRK
jgi:hypothetical protein